MTTGSNRIAWYGFATLVVAFMLSPLVILVAFCFNENPLLSFPMTGFTLGWIARLFGQEEFWTSLQHSLIVAGVVGGISTIVGTLTGLAISRMHPRASAGIMIALTLPIMVPPLMLGVMFLSYYAVWLQLRLGLHTVILSHVVFTQPIVILIVHARMVGFDYAVLDSARDLGASTMKVFATVTLPIIRASIIGAALIAMALSLDDFLVTFFTIGGGNTLPIFMWGMLRKGVDPTINVVAVILMLLSIGVSLIGLRVTRYRG